MNLGRSARRLQRFGSLLSAQRRNLSSENGPKIAVIGSGPAAFYFAAPILRLLEQSSVDLFEKLPVPFGLVRFGVAPDHPEVKNCINQFQKTVETSGGRVNFRGNVTIGKDITVGELRKAYDAVVFCSGAESEKVLGVPGEDAKNCFSARSFVGWYNGHPDFANLDVDLGSDDAAILGHGNVALDVARILLTPIDVLAKTDITGYALERLAESKIRRVSLIGRRGPLEVAFTIKEFREMVNLPNCDHFIDKSFGQMLSSRLEGIQRPKKRLMELLLKTINSSADSEAVLPQGKRRWCLEFLRSPLSIDSDPNGTVSGLTLAVNQLETDPKSNSVKAVQTDERLGFKCGLVVKSLGYRSIRIPELPFDENRQVIPTVDGYRVSECNGVYASGWSSRGPQGVIASTQIEAKNCAVAVSEDFQKGVVPASPSKGGLREADALLQSRGVKAVSWEEWKEMDEEEQARGKEQGKPREKVIWDPASKR